MYISCNHCPHKDCVFHVLSHSLSYVVGFRSSSDISFVCYEVVKAGLLLSKVQEVHF